MNLIIGLAIVLVSLRPMMTAQGETLEGLRQKSGSPFVVYEEQTTNGRGAFKVYLPGVGGDRVVDMSRGYIVKPVGLPISLQATVGTTPIISIHPGFNLIASPTSIATDAVGAIKELGLSALVRLNHKGKFEASLENGPNFPIEAGRGYLAIQKQFTRGSGLIWTEEGGIYSGFMAWRLHRSDELVGGAWTTPTTFYPQPSSPSSYGFEVDATFLPNGQKILYSAMRGCGGGSVGIFEVNLDGSGIRRLIGAQDGFCEGGESRFPSTNDGGTKIITAGRPVGGPEWRVGLIEMNNLGGAQYLYQRLQRNLPDL